MAERTYKLVKVSFYLPLCYQTFHLNHSTLFNWMALHHLLYYQSKAYFYIRLWYFLIESTMLPTITCTNCKTWISSHILLLPYSPRRWQVLSMPKQWEFNTMQLSTKSWITLYSLLFVIVVPAHSLLVSCCFSQQRVQHGCILCSFAWHTQLRSISLSSREHVQGREGCNTGMLLSRVVNHQWGGC